MVKIKNFEHDVLSSSDPLVSTLEKNVNDFLATVDQKDVLDVQVELQKAGRYGLNNAYFATVVYKV